MNEQLVTELNKLLPVVARVHGEHHPELAEVLSLYESFRETGSAETAARLRQITGDFTVPADACPTYRKVYEDLTELTK